MIEVVTVCVMSSFGVLRYWDGESSHGGGGPPKWPRTMRYYALSNTQGEAPSQVYAFQDYLFYLMHYHNLGRICLR